MKLLAATLSAAALLYAAAPAHANAGALLTRGISVVNGPAGTVAGLGLAFMDEYRNADRCLTRGEAATEATVRSGAAAAALGATVGGVLGAALGGDAASIGKGALGLGTIAGMAGAAGANRAGANAIAGSRGFDRRLEIDLCHLVGTARELSAPVWYDLAIVAGPACGVDPGRIFRGDPRVDDFVINRCIRGNARLTAAMRERVAVVRGINLAACRSGLYLVAQYDRELLAEALRQGGSVFPIHKPSCDGTDLSGQYSWLLR